MLVSEAGEEGASGVLMRVHDGRKLDISIPDHLGESHEDTIQVSFSQYFTAHNLPKSPPASIPRWNPGIPSSIATALSGLHYARQSEAFEASCRHQACPAMQSAQAMEAGMVAEPQRDTREEGQLRGVLGRER